MVQRSGSGMYNDDRWSWVIPPTMVINQAEWLENVSKNTASIIVET